MGSGTITVLVVFGVMIALTIGLAVAIRRLIRVGDRAEHEAAKRVEIEQASARQRDESELLNMGIDALADEWDRVEDR